MEVQLNQFEIIDFVAPVWPLIDFVLPVVLAQTGNGYVLQNITGADLQNTTNQTLDNPHP